MKSDIGTEQNDIHVDMRNVRLVRSATRVHKRCSCVLVQCEAGPVKSKIKVKFMENLWLIVWKVLLPPSLKNIFDLRASMPLYLHHK